MPKYDKETLNQLKDISQDNKDIELAKRLDDHGVKLNRLITANELVDPEIANLHAKFNRIADKLGMLSNKIGEVEKLILTSKIKRKSIFSWLNVPGA